MVSVVHLIDRSVELIQVYATKVPLEIFVPLGAFIEEVLAPIPSPFIMTTAGTISATRGLPFVYLAWLALIGSVGKTLGALVLYYATDKAEDFVLARFGKFLGVTHKEIEGIGKRFGKGWQDDVTLFFLRTLPILPSAPISVVSGLIKLNVRTYTVSTFLGIWVRNLLFLYFGYSGIEAYKSIIQGFEGIQSVAQIIMFLTIGAIIAWAYWKRKNGKREGLKKKLKTSK
jgi:membrane protein DedA with SNARE-associated domain